MLGLEQFGLAHDRGSSHGRSRITRQAYSENPAYVPLLERATELWTQPAEAAVAMVALAGCIVVAGRPFAYLRDRTEDMLRLSERAGERLIRWA